MNFLEPAQRKGARSGAVRKPCRRARRRTPSGAVNEYLKKAGAKLLAWGENMTSNCTQAEARRGRRARPHGRENVRHRRLPSFVPESRGVDRKHQVQRNPRHGGTVQGYGFPDVAAVGPRKAAKHWNLPNCYRINQVPATNPQSRKAPGAEEREKSMTLRSSTRSRPFTGWRNCAARRTSGSGRPASRTSRLRARRPRSVSTPRKMWWSRKALRARWRTSSPDARSGQVKPSGHVRDQLETPLTAAGRNAGDASPQARRGRLTPGGHRLWYAR